MDLPAYLFGGIGMGNLWNPQSQFDRTFIRLASADHTIKQPLVVLVRQAAAWDNLPKGWTQESVEKFWKGLTGEAKHKVTRCIERMSDKFDDPGAFCASLADKVDPGWRKRKAKMPDWLHDYDKEWHDKHKDDDKNDKHKKKATPQGRVGQLQNQIQGTTMNDLEKAWGKVLTKKAYSQVEQFQLRVDRAADGLQAASRQEETAKSVSLIAWSLVDLGDALKQLGLGIHAKVLQRLSGDLANHAHNNKFDLNNKNAAAGDLSGLPFLKVPGQDSKVIDMAVSNRIHYDWFNDPRDSRYKEQENQEGFREYLIPRAKKGFKDNNEIIQEAVGRLLKRLVMFEKSALPDLESLGYEVRLHKPETAMPTAGWADYDYTQKVDVTDKVWGHQQTLILTWGFRSWVQVSSRNWTTFNAENDSKASFANILVAFVERAHVDNQAKWQQWIANRKVLMQEKGFQP